MKDNLIHAVIGGCLFYFKMNEKVASLSFALWTMSPAAIDRHEVGDRREQEQDPRSSEQCEWPQARRQNAEVANAAGKN